MKRKITIGDSRANTFVITMDYRHENSDAFADLIYKGGGFIASVESCVPQNFTKETIDNLNFTKDWEKMYDFWKMSKGEFLIEYSQLQEIEYDATCLKTIFGIIEHDEYPIDYYTNK